MSERNYGDARILEFDRQALDWAGAPADPNHPNNHLRHAEYYRKKVAQFRASHAADPYWVAQADLPATSA